MSLTRAEADAIDAAVARVESRTGVQVVTAVVGKSDTYAELPWKAFALGASLAAFAVVVLDAVRPEWVTSYTALLHAVAILGVAACSALAAVFMPPFARLFLRQARLEVEVRQYAESLFLRRELFATTDRQSVLLFVSLYERRVEILPDVGLQARITRDDWMTLVTRLTPALRRGRPHEALLDGLTTLEALLREKGFTAAAGGPGELSNRPIEEAGV